jgi:hypothetical protein
VGFAAGLGFAWASRRSGFRVGLAAQIRSQLPRRDGLGFAWVSRGLRCPDPVSAAQTRRSGFRLGFAWASLPRSGLRSLSAAPDPVSAGKEKAVPPQIRSQLEMLGCVSGGAGGVLRVCFPSFYIASNIIKYFRDYFPKCKQTLKKQSFSLKSFSFANILRWRIFYIETNGALVVIVVKEFVLSPITGE